MAILNIEIFIGKIIFKCLLSTFIAWTKDDNVDRTIRTIGNMALLVKDWVHGKILKKDTIFGIGKPFFD